MKEEKEVFSRGWVIFISLFVQKLLLYWGKPMLQIGKMLGVVAESSFKFFRGFD
jgi:hypothetical protein